MQIICLALLSKKAFSRIWNFPSDSSSFWKPSIDDTRDGYFFRISCIAFCITKTFNGLDLTICKSSMECCIWKGGSAPLNFAISMLASNMISRQTFNALTPSNHASESHSLKAASSSPPCFCMRDLVSFKEAFLASTSVLVFPCL